MKFPQNYQTDGKTTVWSFDFPYLDRSNVFVIVNGAARAFTFIDDHTIKCADMYGNPFPSGLPLVINRATPDLITLAEFKDAANLTEDDLNRARLQCLFLIQERSGGMAGAVGTVISNMTNEIETISGALNDLSQIQGVLTAGLGQFDGLNTRLTRVEVSASTILDQIQQEIDNRVQGDSSLTQRVDNVSMSVSNLSASVNSTLTLLQSSSSILAAKTDELRVHLDALEKAGDDSLESAELAASIISAAVTQVKQDNVQEGKYTSLAQKVDQLQVSLNTDVDQRVRQVESLVKTETTARIDADAGLDGRLGTVDDSITSLAQQITSLQTSINTTINGQVSDLKALVQTEQTARVTADNSLTSGLDQANQKLSSMASQITTVQSSLNDSLAAVRQEMTTKIDAQGSQLTSINGQLSTSVADLAGKIGGVDSSLGSTKGDVTKLNGQMSKAQGKIDNLSAQYTLKAQVTRPDGTVVMGGIGVAATANNEYVGSQIALMANSVVFADPNNANGPLVPFLESGIVDGAPTLVVPSARVGDKTLPGRVLVDGAVEARSIAANSITGDKLVAGSITTDKLQVGLGTNLLKNSTLVNLAGWGTWANGGGTGTLGLDNGADWTLAGGHTMYVRSTGTWGSTDPNAVLFAVFTEKVPVVGGSFYEFSAYVGVHRCAANIGIEWYDGNGAAISSNGYGTPGTVTTVGQAAGGKTLNGYVRIGGIAQAPANAGLALIGVRKGMNVSPDTDSWLFVTQPMMAETHASATRLSPYTPSGLGTLITPEGISTPSLSALSANIGLLRTATWGARTEISNNLIQTFDGNNVLRIRLGVW